MKRSSDFGHFCQQLAEANLSEVDKAVALLWFADHFSPGVERTVRELAEEMHAARLAGRVNISRLRDRLASSRETVKGKARETFRIPLARKSKLDERYVALLKRRVVRVSDAVLPAETVTGTRKYLEELARQINGCYDSGFYDACAVLCRRVVESLLIEAFDNAGRRGAIEDERGNLVGLEDIIGQAKSGKYIKLSRGSGSILDKVKEVGDTAAHHRYHITTEQDIAEFRSGFRKVVSELLALAAITPKRRV